MASDPTKITLRAYDAWAATYDAIDNPLIAQAASSLASRTAWCGGAAVLELGCGTGRNVAFALAAGARRVVGVDGSAEMIAVARRRVEDPRVAWILADLVDGARQAGGGFDLTLICLVLEHVREPGAVVRAAAAALTPGGRLLVLELHPGLHARGIGANFRVGDEEVRLPSFRHDADELGRAMTDAGLTVEEVRELTPDPDALARSAKLARYDGTPVLLELVARRG